MDNGPRASEPAAPAVDASSVHSPAGRPADDLQADQPPAKMRRTDGAGLTSGDGENSPSLPDLPPSSAARAAEPSLLAADGDPDVVVKTEPDLEEPLPSPRSVSRHSPPPAASQDNHRLAMSCAPHRGGSVPSSGDENGVHSIYRTASGRPYENWIDKEGKPVHGCGALFPDGYARDSSVSPGLWVCPVRSCRRLYDYMWRLGIHFRRAHRSYLLNDDGDGTFSTVMKHKGHIGPIVASRGGPLSSRKPMRRPHLPYSDRRLPDSGKLSSSAPDHRELLAEDSTSESEDNGPPDRMGFGRARAELEARYKAGIGVNVRKDAQFSQSAAAAVASPPAAAQTQAGQAQPGSGGVYYAAPSGRLYSVFPGDNGMLVDTCGVPIPDGYKRYAAGNVEWHCPVRWCLSLHARRSGLGIHFGRMHGGQVFNDNLDGTLSEAGTNGLQGTRNVIVSRKPGRMAPPTPAEFASKALEFEAKISMRTRKPSVRQGVGVNEATARMMDEQVMLREAEQQNAKQTWQRIRPHLRRFKTACPEVPWVRQLMSRPRARDIAWNQRWVRKNGFADDSLFDVASMIVQMTGDPAPVPCSWCASYTGPYHECIVLPPASRPPALASMAACANCLYHGQQESCDFMRRTVAMTEQARVPQPSQPYSQPSSQPYSSQSQPYSSESHTSKQYSSQPYAAPPPSRPPPTPCPSSAPAAAPRDLSRQTGTAPPTNHFPSHNDNGGSRGGLLFQDALSTLASADRLGGAADAADKRGLAPPPPQGIKRARASSAVIIDDEPGRPSPLPASSPTPKVMAAARPVPDAAPATDLDMEEWEIAPGRLRSTACGDEEEASGERRRRPENMAFSKAYLADQTVVAAGAGASFCVDVVRSGSSVRWASAGERMRIYSVAAGKVRVRIEGEDEFAIGQHGMFTVRPGGRCVVQNRRYDDAVLHVTELDDG